MRRMMMACLTTAVLCGCDSMDVDDFTAAGPQLILEDYFSGRLRAWGLFEDRFGNVRREFVVDINGVRDGRRLKLTERFVYSDGERETRVWVLEKTGPATYRGTTGNVIGAAVGRAAGNAFNWSYDFNMPVGGRTWKVRFNDWMFLQPDGILLNRITISRWGLRIGTAIIAFRKLDTQRGTDSRQTDVSGRPPGAAGTPARGQ